jgi:hypothetical protein
VSVEIGESACSLALDLAGAYPRDDVRSWRREARLDRVGRRVHVRDSWDLADPSPDTVVHLVLAGTVRLGDGHAVVTALEGAGSVRVAWEPRSARVDTTVRMLDDLMLSNVWG